MLKKSDRTKEFLNEYLRLSIESSFIFTDEENILGFPNYADYVDTRHNQSVLSLLSKKFGYVSFRDPSQWGGFYLSYPAKKYMRIDEIHARSYYPTIFMHHRSKVGVSIQTKIKLYLQIFRDGEKWKYWKGDSKKQ